MATADSIISITGVTKRFGPVTAVDNISFDIQRGEFFSLLGSSGCGKTTLLRMLAGFEQPSEGEISIDREAMAGVPANHRPTNMVFQSYAIFPHLNVRENIGYGLRNTDLSRQEAGKRVIDALELVVLVEERFHVTIPDEEVGKSAFASIDALADFILAAQAGAAA